MYAAGAGRQEAMKDNVKPGPVEVGSLDIEAFAKNLARLVEEGGKALAAYIKPREAGQVRPGLSDEVTDVVKTLGEVAEYWLSDPQRAVELQSPLGKAYLELWGAAVKRLAGENTEPVAAPDPKDRRFADPEWSSNQFFDFVKQAYLLSTGWADHLVKNAEGLDPHTRQKAEFYVQQIANAVSPSNFVLTNPELWRETLGSNAENLVRGMHMLAEDIEAGGGDLKIRQSDASKFEVGRNLALVARQGGVPERADAAHPVRAVDRDGAEAAAADRAALDQQVLRARSHAGEILHQVVRRQRAHGVRDLLGQSRTRARPQMGFEEYMKLGPLAALDAIEQATGENAGQRHRLLRRRHAAGDHARLHGEAERQAHRLGDAVHRAGRFHPRRRSQGVRRRGAAQGASRSAWPSAAISKARRWPTPSTCCARTT